MSAWSEPLAVEKCAEAAGVELRGEEGHPFHCGQRMNVKGGIFGVDFAECEPCGLLMLRIDSPHTNGGYVFDAEQYDAMGENVWVWRPASLSSNDA